MRVPLSWLKEYVDITMPVEDLAHCMTMAGLEVTAIERVGETWDRDKIFVGEVLEIKPHPNADKLVLATVDYGADQPMTVVTGASNLYPYVGVERPGLKVAFATVGAQLIDGYSQELRYITLKPAKIRGVRSEGMVCSEKELGLSEDHEGILILEPEAPVGMPLQDWLGDTVLEIDITPNMARCMSMIGVAREVAALTGQTLRLPSTEMVAEGPPIEGQVKIVIEEPDLCARYSATLIKGVKIGPSPQWMQRRLILAGMRPINNIVDITNYVMLEWGQPLHAFDYDKLVERAGGETPTITVRRAHEGERIVTLDDVERELTPEMLMIADTVGSIAVAGVMGGANTEVTTETTNILLESANFNFINNRRTAAALKLPSQATARFGRGVDPELTIPAARRASEFMRTLAGGAIARGIADAYPRPPETKRILLTTREVRRILGMDVSLEEITRVLESLEFQVAKVPAVEADVSEPGVLVTVPSHRLDVSMAADLVEEIARVIGYENIPATLMRDELPPQRRNLALEGEERVRDLLVGCGLQEVITYSLTTPEAEARLWPDQAPEVPYIRLANPISADRVVMRRTLMNSLLENLALNLKHRERVAVFEIGRVYLPEEPGAEPDLPAEPRRLAIAMTGPREVRLWTASDAEKPVRPTDRLDFFDLKGVVDTLMDRLHVEVAYQATQHPTFHPGRTAVVRVGDVELGVLGEVHPVVRDRFDLPNQRVCLAELDLDALLEAAAKVHLYEPISRYPAVEMDVALVVDDDVPAGRVRELIIQAGGKLLRAVELFDVYRGPQIPEGKKSLAYSLTFQADDRTLTDEEAARLVKRIVGRLEREIGAQLRA